MAGVRQQSAGELEDGIGPQLIEVVGILIAAANREHTRAEHIDEAVHDLRRIAPIRETAGPNCRPNPRRRSAIFERHGIYQSRIKEEANRYLWRSLKTRNQSQAISAARRLFHSVEIRQHILACFSTEDS